jgi:drug/metabolite transporter (DMT)-like permease
MSNPRTSHAWQLQFVVLSAVWGSSFLFIKVLGEHWPALWVAFGRVAVGALTLLLLVRLSGERLVREPRLWAHCAVMAVVFNAAPWTLIAFGEQHTSSIVAGLWNATTPLWTLVISLIAFPEQRPTPAVVGGLGVGFLGVLVLLGPWRALGSGALIGELACAGSALCYGVGFPYTRRYLASTAQSGVVLSACQMSCAAVMLAVFLPLSSPASTHLGWKGIGSLLALGALGSGVAYVLNYAIVRARGASVASTVTYVIPVFSTLLGVVVLSERLYWNEPVGAAVLLAGIALSQRRLPRLASRPT